MIETTPSASTALWQAAPDAGPSSPALGTRPATPPLAPDAQPALPSVGRGQDLSWARSWAQLSQQMRVSEQEARRLGASIGQVDPSIDPTSAVLATLGDMARLSGAVSQSTVRFSLLAGMVNNTTSAVHKLLSQQ